MPPVNVIFVDDDGSPLRMRPPVKPLEGKQEPMGPMMGEPVAEAESGGLEPVPPDLHAGPATPPRQRAGLPASRKPRRSAARRKVHKRPGRR